MNQKRLAVAGISAAMLAGAGAGLAFTWPSGAGASESPAVSAPSDSSDDTSTTTPSTDTASTEAPSTSGTDDTATHKGPLTDILDELVAAGTITQEQADAIKAAIEAKRPAGEFPDHHGGFPGKDGGLGGWHGPRGFGDAIGAGLDAAASAIGITTDELKTELMAGKSIADVATEKGVDVQTVIDAIVAEETSRLTQAVTDIVNGVRPEWPKPAEGSGETTTTTTG
jgi:hypothetical protein